MNHSCHVVLPAAVAPESAQGFRKLWPRAETMCGSWSASCRVRCSELNNVEGEGHGSVGEGHGSVGERHGSVGRRSVTGDRVKTLKVQETGTGLCCLFPRLLWSCCSMLLEVQGPWAHP